MLSGRIVGAEDGAKGFDTDEIVSIETARKFKQNGFTFCLRYISLFSTADEVADGDLTAEEGRDILSSGLGLMAVQHVRFTGWRPSGNLGTRTGNNAANNALFAGLPAGVNVFLDLEGADTSTPAGDVISYCNNWFDRVAALGYIPGIYVGFDSILSGDQLFHSLKFQHYWKSPSIVPDVSVRGYQLLQPEIDVMRHGIKVDINEVQVDRLGGKPIMLVKS